MEYIEVGAKVHWGARALLSTQSTYMAYNCPPPPPPLCFPQLALQCIATSFLTYTAWDCFGPSLSRRVSTKTSSGEFGQVALVQHSFSTKKMASVVEARVAPLAKNRLGVSPKFRCLLAPAQTLVGPSVSGAVS
ncbi:hypothetical protein COCHEDRAFT_1192391 [Bipolaris maydis C5]|uniref:Uncharacterized protein n=1 Tax=Cochliobolus heterostrophus (strain C5 / ATCC 48332 / race O) TaxID=701091 RepID=M2V2M0_COCH5|nr:hypothetical protein COCHEDRAFT_1192391 [Bipolaris maydis C5]